MMLEMAGASRCALRKSVPVGTERGEQHLVCLRITLRWKRFFLDHGIENMVKEVSDIQFQENRMAHMGSGVYQNAPTQPVRSGKRDESSS